MTQFKFISIGIVIGIIIGSVTTVCIMLPKKSDTEKIITKQISGEKIEHDKWNFKGKTISFNTKAAGRGEIETEIPKTMIPEANAWMNRTLAIGFIMSEKYIPDLKIGVTGVGLSFVRRWGPVDFGGGPIAEFTTERNPRFHSFGGWIEAKYWLKSPAKMSN